MCLWGVLRLLNYISFLVLLLSFSFSWLIIVSTSLQAIGDSRKRKLHDTGDLFRFFAMVRNLMLWMDDLMRQASTHTSLNIKPLKWDGRMSGDRIGVSFLALKIKTFGSVIISQI